MQPVRSASDFLDVLSTNLLAVLDQKKAAMEKPKSVIVVGTLTCVAEMHMTSE